jgi:two-component system, NtrC family, response regulator HydG
MSSFLVHGCVRRIAGGDVSAPQELTTPSVHTRSKRMRELLERAEMAARSESTVLITGESGVGKDWAARFIHERSPRRRSAFNAVNCGALPTSLIESELFGHRRGSFTGAVTDHPGLFEATNGGTVFLDEIGELPLDAQVKLLRVLQEREIRRVGDTRSRPIDVRVIAATNVDLQDAIHAKRFRVDLFYRLNVLSIHLPPLRERVEDLPELADALLHKTLRRWSRPPLRLSDDALARLRDYPWPGNVRELENALEHACATTDGPEITVGDLPDSIQHHAAEVPTLTTNSIRPLWEVERDYILATLRLCQGNKTRTAKALRIAQDTLYRKLKQYQSATWTERS